MNRYESAYRDYTIQRGGGGSADESTLYPQRPERMSKNGRAGRAIRSGVKDTTTSDSSAESHLGGFDASTTANNKKQRKMHDCSFKNS